MEPLVYSSIDELKEIVADMLYEVYGQDGVDSLTSKQFETITMREFSYATVSDEEYYRFLYFAISQKYDWLYNTRITYFEYNNVPYSTFLNFVFHLEIVTDKLVKDISALNGDIHKAILINECNPGFNSRVRFYYEGELITSIDYVVSKYSLTRRVVTSLIREGYSPEDAVDTAREISKRHDTKMALKEKGYQGINDFRKQHNLSQDNFYTISKTYKLTPSEIILTIDDLYFEIYGEECLTVNSLSQITGLHINALNSILYDAYQLPNSTLRNQFIEREVDKLKAMLTVGGYPYESVSELSKELNLNRRMVARLKDNSETVEQFRAGLDKMLAKV